MASPEALDFLLTRRSRPAKLLGAPAPGREELLQLLTAAARVPDHGKLEPWRFVVLEGVGLGALRRGDPRPGRRRPARTPDKGALAFEQAPMAVAVVASPKPSDKIPVIEQTFSAGNVALSLRQRRAGRRLGRDLDDRLGGLRPRRCVEGFLGLAPRMGRGFVYLGTCATPPPDRPRPDVPALVTWIDG